MVKVITVCTDTKHYFPYLKDTCKRFGGEFVVLGYNEAWRGYKWKFEKMVEYLSTLEKEELVVFVDGYDVICIRDLTTLNDLYKSIKDIHSCKLVIAHETVTFPVVGSFLTQFLKFYYGSKNNISINAGTYAGFAEDVLYVLKNAIRIFPTENDDQRLIINYANISGNQIYIDTNRDFFFTDVTYLQKFVIPKDTNPYFIHAAACGDLTDVLINMGYTVDSNLIDDNKKLLSTKAIYHTKAFVSILLTQHIFTILLVILLLIVILMRIRHKKYHL